jgi:hypothetical protein
MSARKNRPVDVFKHIDMQAGPIWKNPETGEEKILAYRITYELASGDTLGDRFWRHHCDNPACCNPKHGIPGTNTENMHDMKSRERHGMPHHVVRAIRKLIEQGISDEVIAQLYGKGRSTIYDIRMGVTYGHVKDEEDEVRGSVQTNEDA